MHYHRVPGTRPKSALRAYTAISGPEVERRKLALLYIITRYIGDVYSRRLIIDNGFGNVIHACGSRAPEMYLVLKGVAEAIGHCLWTQVTKHWLYRRKRTAGVWPAKARLTFPIGLCRTTWFVLQTPQV